MIIENDLIKVRSEMELEKLLFFYDCKDKEELSEFLFTEYTVTLILEYEKQEEQP